MRGEKGELFRDEMVRVPELADALVGDARESAAAGRAPVGGKNRLPYDQDANVSIAVMLEDLLDCGRPPQAFGSSGRKKKEKAGDAGIGVEGRGEIGEIRGRKRGEGWLAGGNL